MLQQPGENPSSEDPMFSVLFRNSFHAFPCSFYPAVLLGCYCLWHCLSPLSQGGGACTLLRGSVLWPSMEGKSGKGRTRVYLQDPSEGYCYCLVHAACPPLYESLKHCF